MPVVISFTYMADGDCLLSLFGEIRWGAMGGIGWLCRLHDPGRHDRDKGKSVARWRLSDVVARLPLGDRANGIR